MADHIYYLKEVGVLLVYRRIKVSFYCYYEAPVSVQRPKRLGPLEVLPLIPKTPGEAERAPSRMRVDLAS